MRFLIMLGWNSWTTTNRGKQPTVSSQEARSSNLVTIPLADHPISRLDTYNPITPDFSSVKIDFEDVAEEIIYSKSWVVYYVVGVNPPLHVVEGFAIRIWSCDEIDKIGMVAKGVFIVYFKSPTSMASTCDMNRILFDKKPFIVKPWSRTMSYDYFLSGLDLVP